MVYFFFFPFSSSRHAELNPGVVSAFFINDLLSETQLLVGFVPAYDLKVLIERYYKVFLGLEGTFQ